MSFNEADHNVWVNSPIEHNIRTVPIKVYRLDSVIVELQAR